MKSTKSFINYGRQLIFVSFIGIIAVLLYSCGTMQVYVNNDATYSRKNPITITNSSDETGALGQLQYLLQSNGYRLMSMSAAKKALNLDMTKNNNSSHSEITHTTTVNSVYVLEMHYTYFYDIFYYGFYSFSATITDLVTGEIIMTSNFRGEKSVNAVLNEFVREMNKVIK